MGLTLIRNSPCCDHRSRARSHCRNRRHSDPSSIKRCRFLSNARTALCGFFEPGTEPACSFEIDLRPSAAPSDEDARVSKREHVWLFERGDFLAEWNTRSRCGWIRQSPNPYSIDTLLRLVHSLLLAEEGGFLLHAASAVRRGRAFLFSGISGAGKTTISRLAPSDANLLTDEISYVRRPRAAIALSALPLPANWRVRARTFRRRSALSTFLKKAPSTASSRWPHGSRAGLAAQYFVFRA